jgi:hypothetical protein
MRLAALVVLTAAVGIGTSLASPAAATLGSAAAAPVRTVRISDPRIVESSGLVASPSDPDVVWTVNDSGDSARAFAVSLRTGGTVAVLDERTDARDCEAMTAGRDPAGRPMLWIGDIGDNRADRTSVVLRLLHEPQPTHSVTVTPVSLRVRYPGGPADAESLIWTPDGRLLIVTKGLLGGAVLQVPPTAVRRALAGHDVATPALATVVGRVSQVLPTDGVALPDGRLIVRDYTGATVYQPPAYDGKPLVAQARIPLPEQEQGETMAAVDNGRDILVGSEGRDQYLWRVAVPAAPGPPAASAAASKSAGLKPKPTVAEDNQPHSWLTGGVVVALAFVVASTAGWQLRRARGRPRRR